jgi:hypothetical protein
MAANNSRTIDHTTMPKLSRLQVIATGARRRWTLEEKLRIVAERGPRAVSATARRLGLSPLQGADEAVGFARAVTSNVRVSCLSVIGHGGETIVSSCHNQADLTTGHARRSLEVLGRRTSRGQSGRTCASSQLTARGCDVKRQKGLALGADHYITKPFSQALESIHLAGHHSFDQPGID